MSDPFQKITIGTDYTRQAPGEAEAELALRAAAGKFVDLQAAIQTAERDGRISGRR